MSLTADMDFPQIYNQIRAWAAEYMNSFPGEDNLASNTGLHTFLVDLLSGKDQYKDDTEYLLDLGAKLRYRLGDMAQATHFKDVLGLDFPNCNTCSVEDWTHPLYLSKQPEAKEKLRRFSIIHESIDDAQLFGDADRVEGWYYSKPEHYLAIALVESKMSKDEVTEAISNLKTAHAACLTLKVNDDRYADLV